MKEKKGGEAQIARAGSVAKGQVEAADKETDGRVAGRVGGTERGKSASSPERHDAERIRKKGRGNEKNNCSLPNELIQSLEIDADVWDEAERKGRGERGEAGSGSDEGNSQETLQLEP